MLMEKLNSIYVKTYNFVYLRAKSILKKEEDIQQLMKEVYVKAVAEDVAESAWYEWLGKQVYILGSGKFRKKKIQYTSANRKKTTVRTCTTPKSGATIRFWGNISSVTSNVICKVSWSFNSTWDTAVMVAPEVVQYRSFSIFA